MYQNALDFLRSGKAAASAPRVIRRNGTAPEKTAPFSPRRLSLMLGLTFAGLPLGAAADSPPSLDEVVVSATRVETSADSVAATVTTVDRKAIDRRLPQDEAELFQNEPDVVISRDLRRFGASTVNIRGIEGSNRVLQMVDGIRLPDAYMAVNSNNNTTATADSPELDFLKRVEILRGPASSLYGSDALGGVVGYMTLDPQDILAGRSVGARYKGTWRQADDSLQHTAYLAAGGDTLEGLVAITRRDGHELDNKGRVGGKGFYREDPNPQDTRSEGILAKLVVKPFVGHRIRLTFEDRQMDNKVDTLRILTATPRLGETGGTEEVERRRISADWEWKPAGGWLDRLLVSAFHQKSDNRNYTLQQRVDTNSTCSLTAAIPALASRYNCRLDMDFGFEQESRGLGLQAEKVFGWGATTHQIVAGIDWHEHEVAQYRDYLYTRTRLSTGEVFQTRALGNDNFPTNDFAPGSTTHLGVFVQDEVAFMDGRLTVTPGLRYDHYELKPDNGALLSGTTRITPAVRQSDSAVSPKLSTLWQATPDTAFYGQLVRGFRAPNYLEVNRLLVVTTQAAASIPNPDLKPETSTGLELGSRLKGLGGDLKVAVFDNHYRNFIDTQKVCGVPAGQSCPGLPGIRNVTQHVNLKKVRIYGAEVRGVWKLANNFKADAALAWSRGSITSAGGGPLESIEPMRLALGLGWEGSVQSQPVGVETRLRAATGVSRSNKNGDYYQPGGYGVVDIFGWWQIHPKARLNLAVNNLFDRKYWLWSDVRQASVTQDDVAPAFYTQPGRNLAASIVVDF